MKKGTIVLVAWVGLSSIWALYTCENDIDELHATSGSEYTIHIGIASFPDTVSHWAEDEDILDAGTVVYVERIVRDVPIPHAPDERPKRSFDGNLRTQDYIEAVVMSGSNPLGDSLDGQVVYIIKDSFDYCLGMGTITRN